MNSLFEVAPYLIPNSIDRDPSHWDLSGFQDRLLGGLYSGIGKVAGGVRTLSHVGGRVSNMTLAGLAIYRLLTG